MLKEVREPALDEAAMSRAQGVVWAVCIGVYLTVFIGGIHAGGAELLALGRQRKGHSALWWISCRRLRSRSKRTRPKRPD